MLWFEKNFPFPNFKSDVYLQVNSLECYLLQIFVFMQCKLWISWGYCSGGTGGGGGGGDGVGGGSGGGSDVGGGDGGAGNIDGQWKEEE
jgi:hypothetical protein